MQHQKIESNTPNNRTRRGADRSKLAVPRLAGLVESLDGPARDWVRHLRVVLWSLQGGKDTAAVKTTGRRRSRRKAANTEIGRVRKRAIEILL